MLHFDSDSGLEFTLNKLNIPNKDWINNIPDNNWSNVIDFPNDDWSNMINDIILIAKTRLYNRKKIGINNQSRIGNPNQSRILCFEYNASGKFIGDDINLSANGDSIRNNMQDDEENAGVSTLMINVEINE